MKTGDIIKYILKENGKTQADLARYLGVSSNTVNRWIPTEGKEGIQPSDYHLVKIADYFGIPVSGLTGGYDDFDALLDHIGDASRREDAWISLLETMGYSFQNFSKNPSSIITVKHYGHETNISYNELRVLFERLEEHIDVEFMHI